jgi:hypothetical protein
LELLKNVSLPGSFGSVDVPPAPVSVIVEIILSGTGLKNTVTGYGPGEFVFEGTHLYQSNLKAFVKIVSIK